MCHEDTCIVRLNSRDFRRTKLVAMSIIREVRAWAGLP